MSALLPELFPTNTRYTGSGVAYNLASILGAVTSFDFSRSYEGWVR
jgi:hypothetical protein